jgi:AhpD family alkylhydroperoxidase
MSESTVAFAEYTVESAPAGARRFMAATQDHLGYLPAAVARMAASPHLVDGFGRLTAIFDGSTLDPIAREVVVMTIATRNGCHVCVAVHTARLTTLGADARLIGALRSAAPLADARLDAIRVFGAYTMSTIANRLTGAPVDGPLRAFAWEQ